MRRVLTVLFVLGVLGVAVGLWLTRAVRPDVSAVVALSGDAARGEAVFWAGGCASCHAAPGTTGEAKLVLAGGYRIESPFGAFLAPNISPHPAQGLGAWTLEEFAVAMRAGVSPEGRHYYPAFPYGTYGRMTDADVADLWAFLQGLPADATPSQPHEVGLPFSIRRGIGVWKQLYLSQDWVAAAPSETLERGRYLVEAVSHCAECHTPRDAIGGLDTAQWMGGAANPSGKGKIPNITPAHLDWSAEDIAYYLETGFTPDFDSAGGSMASVIEGMAKIAPEDRAAIAAYVKGLAPVQ